MSIIDSLEDMLAKGNDSALLRFTLGQAYLKESLFGEALRHLEHALELSPTYSAAWKLYGKALSDNGCAEDAMQAYRQGISAAETNGDIQAAKEMKVFLKRLEKQG